MTNRVKCGRCDNEILEATARKNNGLCAICKRDQGRVEFDAIVQGWMENPETLPGTHGIPEPEGFSLRLAASELKKRLYPNSYEEMEIFCHEWFNKAYDKWSVLGNSALFEKERFTLAVETFYEEITNGGLLQYLGNESGAFAEWAADAFEVIGIPAYASLMRDLKSHFLNGVIPADPKVRDTQVEAIDEGLLERLEQEFWDRYFSNKTEIRRKLYRYLNL